MSTQAAERTKDRIPVEAALQVIADLRADKHVVITNQASARHWPQLSDHALDFNYNPSTMGGAIPFGLGIALARPQREVIVVSGDGSLLMSLGSLVTVIDSGASNISIIVLDNAMYEVTGGQKTPASQGDVDFAGLGRASGFPNVAHFWEVDDWRARAAAVLSAPGPRLVWLEVRPTPAGVLDHAGVPIVQQVASLRAAL